MLSIRNNLGRSLPPLVAVLALLLAPAVLSAETVIFRNDTRAALTVQTVTVVRSVLKRDQYLLRSTETSPKIKVDVDKVIQIADARTGRVLLKDVLRVNKKPVAYSIMLDRTGRVRLVAIPMPATREMKKP